MLASVYGTTTVIELFRLEIFEPSEPTAETVTAFFAKTVPEGGLGIAVLILVVTVAELEPVPKALAGMLILKLLPMSGLVINPPVVGVMVSGLSGFMVKPLMAVKVMVCPVTLLPLTVTVVGPPS